MAITAGEAAQFSNISATTAAFTLKGGNYAMPTHATAYGTVVQLQILAFDGVTWVNVGANVTTDGMVNYNNLPPGQYRIAITGATGVYAVVARVPA